LCVHDIHLSAAYQLRSMTDVLKRTLRRSCGLPVFSNAQTRDGTWTYAGLHGRRSSRVNSMRRE
jgi:hypothetical protein